MGVQAVAGSDELCIETSNRLGKRFGQELISMLQR